MLKSKVLAVALFLILGSTLSDVGAKSISKRHVRRDWLIIPDTIAFNVYEAVNKVSPKTAEFLANAVQTPIILEGRNFLIEKTAKITILGEQLLEEFSRLWKEVEKQPVQH